MSDKNLKIEDKKDVIASPKKMDTNANKTPTTEVSQTESTLDPKKSADGDSLPKDYFIHWGGHLILQFVVLSACSITYLTLKKDGFNLQLYIPDNVLSFGIVLTLASLFALLASYLYAQLTSEKFLKITLRNKLAAAQAAELIRSIRSANDDVAQTSLTRLDERIKMMVVKNKDVLRLSSAETDQKIGRLISENDQQIRLLAAITQERIRLFDS
ncbi:hypothetical protein TNIN_95751 [Trichonephila inaurata madagascariensis]|uniref:Uncharacterized protein n=1 Tax=Trichonephila inaurata madagascariensis TaxID=2747483 RepID=A0A8X6X663_9ARAC|nr:hypothetical protein TNIN_95751 [Trichonephila inaurata madagascariensis]